MVIIYIVYNSYEVYRTEPVEAGNAMKQLPGSTT